jgi:hypothetical protein
VNERRERVRGAPQRLFLGALLGLDFDTPAIIVAMLREARPYCSEAAL